MRWTLQDGSRGKRKRLHVRGRDNDNKKGKNWIIIAHINTTSSDTSTVTCYNTVDSHAENPSSGSLKEMRNLKG